VDYIILAIPVFFLLIGLELVITRLQEKDYYRLSDSLSDLGCGIVQQLLEVLVKTALFAGYLYVYRFHLFTLSTRSPLVWIGCLLGVDFLYYWFHRMSHEVNAFWAAHVVHHQSEEFNLSVALRQGAFQGWFSWVFYLPLALLGFPPLLFLSVASINTLYQFWIHTRTIGKLGPLEWVLNTPSHHRVHHGRNPKYIDRNHAGSLIIWDRMFGTFQEEEEEPVYGITSPLKSWNPVWANLHYWVELVAKARRAHRLSDKVRMFLKPPGWHPEELGGFVPAPEVDHRTYRKFDTPVPRGLALYGLVQFTLALLGANLLLFQKARLGWPLLLAGSVLVFWTLAGVAALFERRRTALALEVPRLVLVAVLGVAALSGTAWPAAGAAVLLVSAAALIVWVSRYRDVLAPDRAAA
jgi:sterol desaturase/sphingolipid hydroxylase (fatty acid hydroxylase superfamily)